MNLNLDYSIYTDAQRTNATAALLADAQSPAAKIINQHISSGRDLTDESVAGKTLSQLADYILFGKDPQKLTNAVQRKEISKPATHYSTFTNHKTESLDALLQQPTFNENEVQPEEQHNTYTHPKPKIDNNYKPTTTPAPQAAAHCCPRAATCANCTKNCTDTCDAAIPGMVELWAGIQRLQEKEKQPHTPMEQYHLRHWLIDLRRHQYYLKEAYKPRIPEGYGFTKAGKIDWDSNSAYWQIMEEKDMAELPTGAVLRPTRYSKEGVAEMYCMVREHKLDLTNPQHIYCLLMLYDELVKASMDDLDGDMKWILEDLDEIGRRTQLTPAQDIILDRRVLKWTNDRISEEVRQLTGLTYDTNYISIIFKHNICNKLAQTARLMDEQFQAGDDPTRWKRCSCCGQRKLISDYNFVHKNGTKDGYSARCKKCDAERRKEVSNKERENNGKQSM